MRKQKIIYSFIKPKGAWRNDAIPGFFEKQAELFREYPNGELTGDVHSDRRDFIIWEKSDDNN